MREDATESGPAPITPLGEWSGPAINNPMFAGNDKALEGFLADASKAADAAVWVSQAVGSGIVETSAHDAAEGKVLAFLTAWRRRHGKAKLDELKRKVLAELARNTGIPESAEQDARQRIIALFDEIVN
jgi:hypothetical protein